MESLNGHSRGLKDINLYALCYAVNITGENTYKLKKGDKTLKALNIVVGATRTLTLLYPVFILVTLGITA